MQTFVSLCGRFPTVLGGIEVIESLSRTHEAILCPF